MGLYSINKIKLGIENYRQYWLGTPGIGKSTAFRDMVMEEYGDPDFGLLISAGNETGYKSLDNLNFVECEDWFKFTEVIDDLVDNKADNKIKVVAIDTVDELVYIAEQYALYTHKIRNNGAAATSIKSALGGYAAGAKFAREQIVKQISRLERAGYSVNYIGHTKYRDLTDGETEQTYQMLTTNMELPYHAIFANRCDVMVMMYVKREIKDGKLGGEKRYMRFRGNNTIECKSRIANLPEEIGFDIKEYLETLKSALETMAGVSGKQADKQRAAERIEVEEKAKKFVQAEKTEEFGDEQMSVADYRDMMLKVVKSLDAEGKAQKKSELKKAGLSVDFATQEDMEILKATYKILTS